MQTSVLTVVLILSSYRPWMKQAVINKSIMSPSLIVFHFSKLNLPHVFVQLFGIHPIMNSFLLPILSLLTRKLIVCVVIKCTSHTVTSRTALACSQLSKCVLDNNLVFASSATFAYTNLKKVIHLMDLLLHKWILRFE